MNRSEVRAFIEEGVNQLVPAVEFQSGKLDDYNSYRSHTYPSVFFPLSTVSGSNPNSGAPQDEWPIELLIGKQDKLDSNPEAYEAIIDECDLVAQKLMYKYNRIVDGYKLVTLDGREREPFVKKLADCVTGVYLRFTIHAPDQTDVCV